jgi:hypothetical protein
MHALTASQQFPLLSAGCPDPLARSGCHCWSDRRGLASAESNGLALVPVVCCAIIQVHESLVPRPLYPTPLLSHNTTSTPTILTSIYTFNFPSPPFLHLITSHHVESHPSRHQTQPCRQIPQLNHHPPFQPACLTPQVIGAHGRRPQPPIQEVTRQST